MTTVRHAHNGNNQFAIANLIKDAVRTLTDAVTVVA